jgi:serine acetyltransferase
MIGSLKKIVTIIYYGSLNSFKLRDPRCLWSCTITFKIPDGVHLPHPVGVVIGKGVVLGRNVVIMQNSTIGVGRLGDRLAPVIKDDVFIGPGAVIVGNITIGAGAFIGANAVVNHDVLPGERVVAPRAFRKINKDNYEKSSGSCCDCDP